MRPPQSPTEIEWEVCYAANTENRPSRQVFCTWAIEKGEASLSRKKLAEPRKEAFGKDEDFAMNLGQKSQKTEKRIRKRRKLQKKKNTRKYKASAQKQQKNSKKDKKIRKSERLADRDEDQPPKTIKELKSNRKTRKRFKVKLISKQKKTLCRPMLDPKTRENTKEKGLWSGRLWI